MAADKNIKITSEQIDTFDTFMNEYKKDHPEVKSRFEFFDVMLNKYGSGSNTEPTSKINSIKKTIVANCSWILKNTQYIPTSQGSITKNKVIEIIESANAL